MNWARRLRVDDSWYIILISNYDKIDLLIVFWMKNVINCPIFRFIFGTHVAIFLGVYNNNYQLIPKTLEIKNFNIIWDKLFLEKFKSLRNVKYQTVVLIFIEVMMYLFWIIKEPPSSS